MTGYTRQSTFIPGDVIKAEHGNDEFNQVVAALAQATGHAHDGTAAEGAYVPVISDTTNTDKVEIVTGGARTTGTHQVTGLLTADTGVAITGNITVTGTVDGRDIAADGTALDGKADVAGDTFTGDITVPNLITAGNVDGRDVSVDGTKLDSIESSATADQTAVEIKTAYVSQPNTFQDADRTKLDGIATSANLYVHPTHPGDDFSVDTGLLSGATVVSDIDINVTTDATGHVTDANGTVATRTLTAANIGAQPVDADLTAIAALANTNSNFIVGNGSAWVAESGSTVRTSLGLGTSATLDVGTSANEVVQLNGSAQLPAVDGSLLTGIAGIFSVAFTSTEQTISHAGGLSLPHSLGAAPSLIQIRVICKVAEFGYGIGDEIIIPGGVTESGGDAGVSVFMDGTTDIGIRFNGQGAVGIIRLLNKTSGDVEKIDVGNAANWKLIVKAWV